MSSTGVSSFMGKGGKGYGKGGKFGLAKRFKQTKDPLLGITIPAIRRLARRAGIKRINKFFYTEIRGILKAWLEQKMKTVKSVNP